MNPYVAVLIFNALRLAMSSGLFDRVSAVVRGLINAHMDGGDKKEAVRQYLRDNRLELRGIMLDGVIFVTRLRYELK